VDVPEKGGGGGKKGRRERSADSRPLEVGRESLWAGEKQPPRRGKKRRKKKRRKGKKGGSYAFTCLTRRPYNWEGKRRKRRRGKSKGSGRENSFTSIYHLEG